ncbi:MAG: hypothetical protein D6741_17930, partial [Planctomycetota bacterium]
RVKGRPRVRPLDRDRDEQESKQKTREGIHSSVRKPDATANACNAVHGFGLEIDSVGFSDSRFSRAPTAAKGETSPPSIVTVAGGRFALLWAAPRLWG